VLVYIVKTCTAKIGIYITTNKRLNNFYWEPKNLLINKQIKITMGFFDKINPFKKNNDFLNNDPLAKDPLHHDFSKGHELDPLHSPTPGTHHDPLHQTQDPLHSNPLGKSSHLDAGPSSPQQLDDPRMTMPLGQSMRQKRIEAMHSDYNEPAFDESLKKDFELISSKLDYLKATLESINQRLANLEQIARREMDR